MHELSICMSILSIVEEEVAKKDDVTGVKTVTLKVGELSCLEARTLTSCFEVISEKTIADGAKLVVNAVKARWACKACGHEFEERLPGQCPACEKRQLKMVAGREFLVESLEVETE